MAESFEEICANIKACLNSSKSQISISDLNRDYVSVLGTPIPFRALGFRSLDQLIREIPDLKISNVGGDTFIDVKVDEKTKHITNLVRGQKSSKKKPSSSKGRYGYRKPPPPKRVLSPPKYYKPANSRYPPKYHDTPRQSAPSNYHEVPQHTISKYPERRYAQAQNTAPKPIIMNSRDPRHNAERYQNGSYYIVPKCLKVPQYSSAPKHHELPNYNSQNNFGGYSYSHNNSNSKSREPSYSPQFSPQASPQFSPTFSDPEDTPNLNSSTDSHGDSKFDRSERLLITSGNDRKVILDKNTSRSIPSKMTKQNSTDEDFGYSSMNEIPTQNNDFTKLSDTDFIISNTRKMSLKHTPAAMVAAGRAMIEPKKTFSNIELMETSPAPSIIDEVAYSRPFRTVNRQPPPPPTHATKLSEFMMDVNSLSKSSAQMLRVNSHSSPLYGKASPNPTKPTGPPAPSKMSDPFMFTPGPHTAPTYAEGTACCQLLNYTRARKLPVPEFKNFNKPDSVTGVKQFLSRVKIGDMNFSSFQLETTNLTDAQEYVSKVALEDLRRRLDSVDSAVLPYTNNKSVIIDRVAEIVNPHVTGLKSTYVESQYKLLYREILPLNWTDIIENRSLLSVEKLVGGLFVYPANDENVKAANVTSLQPLILPLSNTWDVFITFVSSSNKIYFRIIHEDYNGRYETMAETMEMIYESEECKKQPIEIVKEGNFYAALIDSTWFRVKAMGTADDDKLIVLLIDLGQVEEVAKDAIYPLDEQLTKLPAQAVRCGLTNLEEYCNNTYISEVIDDYIYGKSLVAHVDSRNPRLQLTLHDTCTDEDVNINELILEKIKNELTPPKIPAKNSLTPVRLTSVLEDGQAYVQLISDGLATLEELLERANEEIGENEEEYIIKDPKELVGTKMCLVKYIDDGKWHRGSVGKLVPDTNEAQVVYVDYGNLEIVPFNRMADCQRISTILSEIPPQAIRVELVKPTQEIFTEKIIDFLMNLALPKTPDDSPHSFLMKVVEDRNLPYVELFVRLGEKDLHAVNDVIGTCFQEYRGKNFKPVKISKELDEKFRPIPAFPLPPPEEAFYVYVYMVSNPHEFFVQPHDFRQKLKDLMAAMNEFYSSEVPAVNIENLTKGQVYAVKCEDNLWYRCICHQIIESMNLISMKLVDYGNIISVKFKDVAHLLPCFRELPCLAIKAELAGIVPKNLDWDISDCIRFKDLVYEKVLISFVADDTGEKASMILIDTSTGAEIDIGGQLVSEGHALDITLDEGHVVDITQNS